MKRRFLAPAAAAIMLLGFAAAPASAHVLKTDGTIGAVLHINPDDDPVTGSPTSYVLYFDDTAGRFTLPACDCTVAVQEQGATIHTQALTVTNALDSSDTYTFPRPGVYTLSVSGRPKTAGVFAPFTLNYLVRVQAVGGASGTQPFPVLLWVGLGLMVGLILLAAYKSEHTIEQKQ